MHAPALLVLAATSRVPFYVAGGCFAAWAVLISVLGFTHKDFPSSDLQQRLLVVLTVLLAAGTIGSGIATG
jgi:hypothetical protein